MNVARELSGIKTLIAGWYTQSKNSVKKMSSKIDGEKVSTTVTAAMQTLKATNATKARTEFLKEYDRPIKQKLRGYTDIVVSVKMKKQIGAFVATIMVDATSKSGKPKAKDVEQAIQKAIGG